LPVRNNWREIIMNGYFNLITGCVPIGYLNIQTQVKMMVGEDLFL